MLNTYRIELFENKELTLEGCKTITKYTSEEINVETGGTAVKIHGAKLTMPVLFESTLQVRGIIKSVELCQSEKQK